MRRINLRFLIPLVLMALLLAACGSDDDSADTDESSTETGEAADTDGRCRE